MKARVREPICRAVMVGALLSAAAAAAQAPATASFAGSWQAGATSMEVAVESWGKDCGPQPQSTHSGGGGTVRIEQQQQALIIHGGGRDVHSDQCWSPNPMLRRVSSSHTDGQWVTRCKTADQDPREEAGTYTLKALSSDRLLYQDVSHFNWKLNASTCVATITTTQTLQRVAAAAPAPAPTAAAAKPTAAATKPASAPAAKQAACKPGAAAHLSLRPRRAQIELGQHVCFHPRVADAAGCTLENAAIVWSLEHGPGIKASLQGGCFHAGDSSAESEGAFKIVASYGGLRAEAPVVVSAESLTALLASRMQTEALTGEEAAPEPAAAPPPASTPSTRVVARAVSTEDPRSARRWLVALAALLAAASAGLFLIRRSNPRARASNKKARARVRRCPSCGATYPESHAFCGVDGSALSPPQ